MNYFSKISNYLQWNRWCNFSLNIYIVRCLSRVHLFLHKRSLMIIFKNKSNILIYYYYYINLFAPFMRSYKVLRFNVALLPLWEDGSFFFVRDNSIQFKLSSWWRRYSSPSVLKNFVSISYFSSSSLTTFSLTFIFWAAFITVSH